MLLLCINYSYCYRMSAKTMNKKKTGFVPISPVRDEVKRFNTYMKTSDYRKPWNTLNEVERHLDKNKVSRNLSEVFRNPSKPYSNYIKRVVKERLRYDD